MGYLPLAHGVLTAGRRRHLGLLKALAPVGSRLGWHGSESQRDAQVEYVVDVGHS